MIIEEIAMDAQDVMKKKRKYVEKEFIGHSEHSLSVMSML